MERQKWDEYYAPRNKAFRDAKLEGKELVVSGKFTENDGRPQIMLTETKQIRLVK